MTAEVAGEGRGVIGAGRAGSRLAGAARALKGLLNRHFTGV